jgi:hypothetical protein
MMKQKMQVFPALQTGQQTGFTEMHRGEVATKEKGIVLIPFLMK